MTAAISVRPDPPPLVDITDATVEVTDPRPARILGPVTFTVAENERVAIVGPSGAGKSTLVSVVGGMTVVSGGSYRFAGCEVPSTNPRRRARFRARHVGFLFQHPRLIEERSVADNVMLGLSATPDPQSTVAETLDVVGIAHLADRPARYLSGGERHRVALARALVKQPQLLVADEPTGSLDRQTGRHILDLLSAVPDRGITLLLVTHDEDAAGRADRRLRLVDGILR